MLTTYARVSITLGIVLLTLLLPAVGIAADPPPGGALPGDAPPRDLASPSPAAVDAAGSDAGAPVGTAFVLAQMATTLIWMELTKSQREENRNLRKVRLTNAIHVMS